MTGSDTHNISITKKKSLITKAIIEHKEHAEHELIRLSNISQEDRHQLPAELYNCIFIGHIATDCDSISSAIACADLFNGIAVRASDLNTEIQYSLDYWKYDRVIQPMEDYVYMNESTKQYCIRDNRKIVLVDHNQQSQFNDALKKVSQHIVGVIDHHALQNNTLVTDMPIYVNIRPWGSASTIVSHMYITHDRLISTQTAGLLLSAILSDTLNLHSPTTTPMDKFMVSLLAQVTGTVNVDHLAHEQFQAKSKELALVSSHALIRGDSKQFKFSCNTHTNNNKHTVNISFGVIETVSPDIVLQRINEILHELQALKHELNVDIAYLAVVDIVKLNSKLILVSEQERSLARIAYNVDCSNNTTVVDLGKRVSRKKEFIPPLSDAISKGWLPETSSVSDIKTSQIAITNKSKRKLNAKQITQQFGEVIHECTDKGCRTVRLVPQHDNNIHYKATQEFIEPSQHTGKTAKPLITSKV